MNQLLYMEIPFTSVFTRSSIFINSPLLNGITVGVDLPLSLLRRVPSIKKTN